MFIIYIYIDNWRKVLRYSTHINFTLFLGLLAFQNQIKAQPENLKFSHYSSSNGLLGPYNDFVYQDSFGYVWISSLEGVYCSDGTSIQQYIPNQQIQSNFFEDSKNNLWFTSYEAIYQYYRKTDTLFRYQIVREKEQINQSYHLFYLEQDNWLWLQIEDYIYRINRNDLSTNSIEIQENHIVGPSKGRRFGVRTNENGSVEQIYACFWIGDSGFEFMEISEGGKLSSRELFWNDGWNGNPLFINSAFPLTDEITWFSSNQGVLKFNYEDKSLGPQIKITPSGHHTFGAGELYKEQFLMVPEKTTGLWMFDLGKEKFINNFDENKGDPNSISTNSIIGVNIDRQENLWLAHNNLAKVDFSWLNSNSFQNPMVDEGEYYPAVTSLVEDKLERIWCTTKGQGLRVYDRNGKLKHRLQVGDINYWELRSLSPDNEGDIWGVGGSSIVVFDPWTLKGREVLSDPSINVFDLIHVSNDVKLVASNKGILELHRRGNEYLEKVSSINLPSLNFQVFNLFQGSKNVHFIPINASDLLAVRFNNDSLKIVNQISFPGEVYDVIYKEENEYLVATASGLYSLYRNELDSIVIKPRPFGLPEIRFNNINRTKNGGLWLTSNRGLWNYEPCEQQYRRFNFEEGFPVESFSTKARLQATNGRLWFGGNNGLMVFHPDSITSYPYLSPIRFRSIEINDELKFLGDTLQKLETLHLKHFENSIQLNLSAITHYFPDLNNIYYRLNGLEKGWQKVQNGNPIRYSGLIPKQYELEVFSTNANGLKSPVITLTIIVSPPIWDRWWFKAGCILFSTTIFFLIFRTYVQRKIKLVEERQKGRQEEQDRIGKDLHDNLGAGLTDIRFISELGLMTENKVEVTRGLHRINKYALELLENMQEIVWALDQDQDTLENLLITIKEYVNSYFEDKRILFSLQMPHQVNDIVMKGERRRNILLIIKEILHNAVKHAHGNKIDLVIALKNHHLHISIEDDGNGFQTTNLTRKGRGLTNIQKRADALNAEMKLNSILGKGTNYQLIIPLMRKSSNTSFISFWEVLSRSKKIF